MCCRHSRDERDAVEHPRVFEAYYSTDSSTRGPWPIRGYLGLPPEIVPATHKASNKRPEGRDREEDKFQDGGRPAFRDNRQGGFGRGGGI